jgi:hypothetical protein
VSTDKRPDVPMFVGGPPIWSYTLVPLGDVTDLSPEEVRQWDEHWAKGGQRGSGIRWVPGMQTVIVWDRNEPTPGLFELEQAYLAALGRSGKPN